MLIFDAHLDIAWNAIDWNRDLMTEVTSIRATEAGMPEAGRGGNTVSFPEMRRGEVGICIATVLPKALRPTTPPIQPYCTPASAFAAGMAQVHYYEAMTRLGVMAPIQSASQLEVHLSNWELDSEVAPIGYILSMEGADSVVAPDQLDYWWNWGLRIIGPAHYGVGPYSSGTGAEGGLQPQGFELVRAMNQVGMMLDVTHLTDQAFREALDIFTGPVLASHHNSRTLVPHQRQLTDEQILEIVARGAVIGMALDTWMMVPGWVRGESKPDHVRLERIIDHIDHICQLTGTSSCIGIGTDLDGGFGREQSPGDMDSIADLQRLAELLSKRHYDDEAIRGIMHENWISFFRDHLPK